MAFTLTRSAQVQTDMYIGGAAAAVAGTLADRAPTSTFLSKYNITNGEALYAADIVGTALFRKKLHGHAAGIADAAVAGSTFALVERFMQGKTPSFTTSTSTVSGTPTGWEVSDPALGQHWGNDPAASGGSGGPGAIPDYGDDSDTGFGID